MKMPRQLSANEKRWVMITLAVAVAALGYGGIVEPILKKTSGGNSQLDSKRATFKKNLDNMARYETLNAEYKKMFAGTPGFGSGKDATDSLKTLEQVAQDCGVSLISIKPQPVNEEEGPKHVLFDVAAQSSALSLTRFLYRLESSSYLMRVKRVTTSSGGHGATGLQFTLLISQLILD